MSRYMPPEMRLSFSGPGFYFRAEGRAEAVRQDAARFRRLLLAHVPPLIIVPLTYTPRSGGRR